MAIAESHEKNFSDIPLEKKIELFIDEKHFLGYRYQTEKSRLLGFHMFLQEHHIDPLVSKDTVMEWVDSSSSVGERNYKISVIREFALFLNRLGEEAYVIPNTYRAIKHKSFCPYIYSKNELATIFRMADQAGKVGKIPHSEVSFPLIARILYGCGLRITESLSLKVKHVDLHSGVLTIEDAKFFKNRLIPMHENLTKRCLDYSQKVLFLSKPEDFFFPSGKSTHISKDVFYQYFRKILSLSGIRPENMPRGPRVHDIRHTFAVHCLKKLDDAGMDMNAILPVLATYMGHTTYEGTGTYLRLTSELHSQVSNTVDELFGNLIPLGGCEVEN